MAIAPPTAPKPSAGGTISIGGRPVRRITRPFEDLREKEEKKKKKKDDESSKEKR
jgi:hypothetical protein